MAEKQIFETVLEKYPGMEATGITIPFDVEKVFGAKRVPVKASINGAEYCGSIVRMGGVYCLGVPKVFREAAAINAGEHIVVTVERDTDVRTVSVPKDLAEALTANGLSDAFEALSYTHRKEHVRAIVEAKAPETRIRRIQKAIEIVAAKKK
ncbi:MAG: YdeI/OmpD-associated family protein [Pyrinomonadaceae bacterium]